MTETGPEPARTAARELAARRWQQISVQLEGDESWLSTEAEPTDVSR
ncbi:hypothetical protein PYV02_14850 [Leifsonia sp. H3M29-4]|nr:hypothetical protein [Salinibacterium metalliresistens]MDF1480361.1 hypothetical protein [Salinibacterium metalliresistens]